MIETAERCKHGANNQTLIAKTCCLLFQTNKQTISDKDQPWPLLRHLLVADSSIRLVM
jgi:hypothetical protein